MTDVSLAEAKARLSELVERARTGDSVRITRRGKPVAELKSLSRPRERIDFAAIEALTSAMALDFEGAGDLVRRMRDEGRY